MKRYIIKLIEKYLFNLAKKRLENKDTFVIAITGSVGKTSTKEAVSLLVEEFFPGKVFASHGNMNESIGIPLAVLGFDYLPTRSGWPKLLIEARKKAKNKKFPKYLILEMGVEKPGDIKYFTKLIKPNIAIITGIGPAHLEQLKNINGVLKEKTELLRSLPEDGVAIINADDSRLVEYGKDIKHRILSYGYSKAADVTGRLIKVNEQGSYLEISSGDLKKQIRSQVFGRHSLMPILAAMAVAKSLDLKFDQALNALKKFQPLAGRMRLIKGVKESLIIDDTYNANPNSVLAALETLKDLPTTGRKVVILGNMNELGDYEEKAHKLVGGASALVAKLLVFIGQNAKIMKEAAEKAADEARRKVEIITFETPSQASISLEELILAHDTILIKASQNTMRLERIVENLMADPKEAKDLLVRQDSRWQKRK